MRTKLQLHSLAFEVFLGWGSSERSQRQRILLDINLDFSVPPVACATDQLTDTVCYDLLIKTLRFEVADQEFRLLEHLAHEIYRILKPNLLANTKLAVTVKKDLQVVNLDGNAIFTYGDA